MSRTPVSRTPASPSRANLFLLWGILLFALFLMLAALGPRLAPYAPDYDEKIVTIGDEVFFSPEKPSPRHLLGTDPWGYDILTLLLYGARYTLMVTLGISALRIGLAIIINMIDYVMGLGPFTAGIPKSLAGIPIFVLVYFLFYGVNFNPPAHPAVIALIQASCITLLGLPRFTSYLSLRVAETDKKEFVEAARSCGAGQLGIFLRHILPQLRESIALNFVQESIGTLNLIGQLGIFDMFIGGTRATRAPLLFHSRTYEWAGLIGSYRGKVFSPDWWVLAFPLGAYLFLLVSLYLISRGIEIGANREQKLFLEKSQPFPENDE